MPHEKSHPLIGATGLTHLSAAEAEASFRLEPLGIVPCDVVYPLTFRDAEGAPFEARSDFVHEASGVWFEYKAGFLNGKKTKANADRAIAKTQKEIALGFVGVRNGQHRMLQHGWNHSVHKQAAVVAALTPARVVLVLKDEPSLKAARRLERAGIFWRTLQTISAYSYFLKLASLGLHVAFTSECHAFRPASLSE